MNTYTVRHRFKQVTGLGWAIIIAAVALSSLAFIAVPSDADPASLPETVKPFAGSNGFTIVSLTDVRLDHLELEGSVAAFGSISTTKTPDGSTKDGFHLIHHSAGHADYKVPLVDGVPVRILANELVGSGTFSVWNEDVSGTIAADSPEALASAKLVDTSTLAAAPVSGDPYGQATADPFLEVTNSESGAKLNLKSVDATTATLDQIRTTQSSVSGYFPGLDAHVETVNMCLASMYSLSADYVNWVQIAPLDDATVQASNFALDRVNIINYEDIAGKLVTLADGDFAPTAANPIVVRVPAGTTQVDGVNFEGWGVGPTERLARHVFLDLSLLSGEVLFSNVTIGSVWAPGVDLNATLATTAAGQMLVNSLETSQSGELHHHSFAGDLPCKELAVTTTSASSTTTTVSSSTSTSPSTTSSASTTTTSATTTSQTTPAAVGAT